VSRGPSPLYEDQNSCSQC